MSKGAALTALTLLLLPCTGCGNKDSVSLSGSITNASLAVESEAIGTFLSGSFELELELGSYASDPVVVEAPTFTLVDGESQSELGIGPLPVVVEDDTFPFTVGPGKKRRIPFGIEGSERALPDDLATGSALETLCAAPVRIAGTVEHSLDGGSTTTVRSLLVEPTGCP